jgi:hypothetical protein
MGHLYEQYESTPAWSVIETAVAELVKNGDLEEKTDRRYIVGYLCQKMANQNGSAQTEHSPKD